MLYASLFPGSVFFPTPEFTSLYSKNMRYCSFVSLARSEVWLLYNDLLAVLLSLFLRHSWVWQLSTPWMRREDCRFTKNEKLNFPINTTILELNDANTWISCIWTTDWNKDEWSSLWYYEFTSYIRSISIIFGLKIDPHNDQFPVCLMAQLVEHCPGIAEVWVRILV